MIAGQPGAATNHSAGASGASPTRPAIFSRREMKGMQRTEGEAGLDPESFHPEHSAAEAPRETLVPEGAEMEDGLRGPDQDAQTAAQTKPQPVSGSGRNGRWVALGVVAATLVNMGTVLASRRSG